MSYLSLILPITFLLCFYLYYSSKPNNNPRVMAGIQPALKSLIVSPRSKHTATVIFVHGLGDSGHGWKPVADMFQSDPALSHVKWVLPHAPTRPVTANMGIEMPSWFDIASFGFDQPEDETGMLGTVTQLNKLISTEISSADLEANRIIIGGFSQGGAMSLLTGLTNERKLGGVAVMSGWLPLRHKFQLMATPHAKNIPLFWGHGKDDPLVLYKFGTDSRDFLTNNVGFTQSKGTGTGLEFHSYDGMQHSSCKEELDDLRAWIKKVIPQ